jgi:hypothetical protein
MKTLTLTAVAALLIATPVFAQGDNPVPPGGISWEQLVAKANADRLARAGHPVVGDTAAIKNNSATDAGQAPARVAPQPIAPTGHYSSMADYWQDRS